MGGTAFAQHKPPIPTPRLCRPLYKDILSKTVDLLHNHYTHVASPIEAPGKETYGDLDIIVCKPLEASLDESQNSREELALKLKGILNAKAYIVNKGDAIVNFAIPLSHRPRTESKKNKPEEEIFVQVDIKLCLTCQDFDYSYFHSSHGDLWIILSLIIKPYGLWVNNRGMYLRIASIELQDQKKSLVFLSSNPAVVLEFIGLDQKKWWKEMDSRDDIFNYAASCRMFNIDDAEKMPEFISASYHPDDEGCEQKKLKHQIRRRYVTRPLFRAWVDDFIPKCRSKRLYSRLNPPLTRHQIKQEAFAKFNVKKEFEEKEREWAIAKNDEEVWKNGIKGMVSNEGVDPAIRAAGLRVLKEIIVEGKACMDDSVPNEVQRDENGFHDLENVKRWVLNNWLRAGEFGFQRQLAWSIANNKSRKSEQESM
ncbi:hypothetical protein GcM3_214008 [Golovinomyces cichoracearum]|uniref:Uncharacterized protein n=1 Tax=Golovinomyces cichoracearum TaxID=62708 RepID=A0A420H8Z4_9PEZI|nr:hypothetical protein GcM3_214008 [Golovinomyces cichoracearum]